MIPVCLFKPVCALVSDSSGLSELMQHSPVTVYYLCMGCAGIATPESRVTACVLQAETGLVSLRDFPSSDDVQQVVVTEGVHAVVVPEGAD